MYSKTIFKSLPREIASLIAMRLHNHCESKFKSFGFSFSVSDDAHSKGTELSVTCNKPIDDTTVGYFTGYAHCAKEDLTQYMRKQS